MKANELRIGSVLRWIDEPSRLLIVSEIGINNQKNRFVRFENGDGSIIDDEDCMIEPIPLTEEWLENFGAKRDDLEIDSYVLSSLTCDYRFFKSTTIDGYIYWTCEKVLGDTCIEYVHQLQNLYFALTGQELEFSE